MIWRARLLLVLAGLAMASAANPATLTLTWRDNSDNETGFEIERSTDGLQFAPIATVGESVTSYADATVVYDTEYWYRVRAYNGVGASGYTNIASGVVATPNTAPSISPIADVLIEEGRSSSSISFTISDNETASSSLLLTAASDNQGLIANSGIALGGSSGSRTLQVTPLAGQVGTANITVTVSDGGLSATSTFTVTVDPNAAPVLAALSNVTAVAGTVLDPISISFSDEDTALSQLTVTVTSSNQSLVTNSGITVTGSGGAREIALSPVAGAFGSSTIVIRVSDGLDEVTGGFTLTLTEPSGPSISGLQNVTVTQGEPIGDISFTASDPDTSSDSLQITASSSNQDLLPNSGISISNAGGSQSISLTPNPEAYGETVITVTVSDGARQATSGFTLAVERAAMVPQIDTAPSAASVTEGNAVSFTVAASGYPTPTLQWYKDGQALIGATSATYSIAEASLSDAGLYHAVATNEAGSATSATALLEVEKSIEPVDAPTGIAMAVSSEGSGGLALSWTDNSSNETGFQIERSLDGVNFILLDSVGAGVESYLDTTATPDVEHSYRVRAYSDDAQSDYTEVVSGTLPAPNTAPSIAEIEDQTVEESQTLGPIILSISDAETPAGQLQLAAASDDQNLVADKDIAIEWQEGQPTIALTPVAGATGTASITVEVSDGELSASSAFVVTVDENSLPVISPVADMSVWVGSAIAPVAFTVSDEETPVDELHIRAVSSNKPLLLSRNAKVIGSGGDYVLEITPEAGAVGSTVITIHVNDTVDQTSESFTLTVAEPSGPSISGFEDITVTEGDAINPIGFTVSDPDTSLAALTVSAVSSNEDLLPSESIEIVSTQSGLELNLTPLAGAFGQTDITVTVSDGARQASSGFMLTVEELIVPPAFAIQPIGTEVTAGEAAYFSVEVTGDPQPALQWYKDGEPIAGATEALFGYGQTLLTDAGAYKVVATNSGGSATSATVMLTVAEPFNPLEDPSDLRIQANSE